MVVLFAGLAIFVSLAALWLASDVQRSVSNKNAELIKSQINPLNEAVKTDRTENGKLRQEVQKNRSIIESLDDKVNFLEDTIQIMQSDLNALKVPAKESVKRKPGVTGTHG